MQKIKIRLPATVTNLGPGLNSLGLALGLYTAVEISQRSDDSLVVETAGEGAGRFSVGLRHPVMLALIRMFQKLERAPLGISVRVNNQIPLSSGLGAEAAFTVAGVIGANNLMGNIYSREQMLDIAAQIHQRSDGVTTAILGGLTASILDGSGLVCRPLPLSGFRVIVILPELSDYTAPYSMNDRVPLQDAVYNLGRVPLVMEAFRSGDLTLLARVIDDRLRIPTLLPRITGYTQAVDAAREAGAVTVTICGDGPALLAFAETKHEKVAEAMQNVFRSLGIKARSWVLPVDTQGVVISIMQSA